MPRGSPRCPRSCARRWWSTGARRPGELFVDRSRDPEGEIVCAAIKSGNVVLLVQPPRGFGENPIAIYHDPDLPLTHHYLATYRWIEEEFGAHAIVHVGKHGNLEWLPGKNLALSADCGPDAASGLPAADLSLPRQRPR
jgi:cobaltochelatase CobN